MRYRAFPCNRHCAISTAPSVTSLRGAPDIPHSGRNAGGRRPPLPAVPSAGEDGDTPPDAGEDGDTTGYPVVAVLPGRSLHRHSQQGYRWALFRVVPGGRGYPTLA